MQETHRNLFEFLLPYRDTKLSQVFGEVERARAALNVKDYSVSQSTLDQVFVNFAKRQDEEERGGGSGKKGRDETLEPFIDAFRSPIKRAVDVGKAVPGGVFREVRDKLDESGCGDVGQVRLEVGEGEPRAADNWQFANYENVDAGCGQVVGGDAPRV
jgi:hypothetical protein